MRNQRRRCSPTLMRGAVLAVTLAYGTPAATEDWQIALGAGALWRPEYPGSDESELRALPFVDVMYGRWFLNLRDGLGLGLPRGPWRLSASIAPEFTQRDESDDARLRGLGDIDLTARAQLRGSYEIDWLSLSLAAGQDIAGQDQGLLIDFEGELRRSLTPRLRVSAGAGLRWADDEYTASFFGVSAEQAQSSAFDVYDAGAGLAEARVFAAASYAFDQHWFATARASLHRLQGDAADSPIVLDDTYASVLALLGYSF
jgi:outer membrane protein